MLVRVLKNDRDYYTLEKGKPYVVFACVFEIHPEHNKISKLYYYVYERTDSERHVLMGHGAECFEIVDATIPDDWQATTIDFNEKHKEIIEAYRKLGDDDEVARRQKIVESFGNRPNLSHVVSFPEMQEYNFFIAVHDDDTESNHKEIILRYKKKYEKLHADILKK